jgi:hypothetical protein
VKIMSWENILKAAKDRRYKVNQEIIDGMRDMRKRGASYQKIADEYGVSQFTANYWTNEETRKKQRAKTAKRTYPPKDERRIKRDQAKRKENWEASPDMKLRHRIQSAIDDKRFDQKTVQGMTMEEARKLLESGKLQGKNRKFE